MARHRGVTSRSESLEKCPLRERRHSRPSVVHGPQNFKHRAVGRPCLDAQDPLPDRREELLGGQRLRVARSRAETVEPRLRQDDRLVLALRQLAEPRIDIAADGLGANIRASMKKEGTPAKARGADARARRQIVEPRPVAGDKDVAGIRPRRVGDERETVGEERGHVLQAVDGRVHAPFQECLLDLLDEERLAPEVREGDVGEPVAGGGDERDVDLDTAAAQALGHQLRLGEGKTAPPAPQGEPHGSRPAPPLGWRPNSSEMNSIQRRW